MYFFILGAAAVVWGLWIWISLIRLGVQSFISTAHSDATAVAHVVVHAACSPWRSRLHLVMSLQLCSKDGPASSWRSQWRTLTATVFSISSALSVRASAWAKTSSTKSRTRSRELKLLKSENSGPASQRRCSLMQTPSASFLPTTWTWK